MITDSEAATYVESVICMRTRFSGEPPYVGWKGLGLALNEALDERDAAIARAEELIKERDDLSQAFTDAKLDLEARTIHRDAAIARAEKAEVQSNAWSDACIDRDAAIECAVTAKADLFSALSREKALREALTKISELDYLNASINCAAYNAVKIARAAITAYLEYDRNSSEDAGPSDRGVRAPCGGGAASSAPAPKAPSAEGWRPIGCAPLNEISFLAYDQIAEAVVSARFDRERGTFVHTWDEAENKDFTHWMPLPAPPIIEKET